jgi:hypothetical protein
MREPKMFTVQMASSGLGVLCHQDVCASLSADPRAQASSTHAQHRPGSEVIALLWTCSGINCQLQSYRTPSVNLIFVIYHRNEV